MTRVGIIGTGAVGCYFIAGLWEKKDVELVIVGDEQHASQNYQSRIINGKEYTWKVVTPNHAGHLDLILIACKYQGLESVCQMLPQMVSKDTIVMSLLNGVDSEEQISKYINASNILYAYMMISSQRVDNQINFSIEITPGLFYGEKDTSEVSERMKKVANILANTSIHHTQVSNIIEGQWNKFALNMMHNLPQAVISCGLGAYDDSQHMAYIAQKLRSEVYKVAKAKGIQIEEYIDTSNLIQVRKAARYSTLQDIDAKRDTEIDMLAGTLVKYAKELQMEVPYSDMIYHMIKAIEEKNRGVFDYETI